LIEAVERIMAPDTGIEGAVDRGVASIVALIV
jgi:hypothetical protein